ncbi:hypothetical protein [Mesorhizobium sp. L2C084A000]|uniref:hypothetical protein n=1 Tax=unclassified Mesorhizobium TaxID=325217 RepID=UPI0012DBD4AB|nr:hypothetical protein [Mesorhizobium sp. L2C084A000]
MLLPALESHHFYVYLLTSPYQTSGGCCQLPDAHAIAESRLNEKQLSLARTVLIEDRFVIYDPKTEEYFIIDWFKDNPPMGEKHRLGVIMQIDKIVSKRVRGAALSELERLCPVKLKDESEVLPFKSGIHNTAIVRNAGSLKRSQ